MRLSSTWDRIFFQETLLVTINGAFPLGEGSLGKINCMSQRSLGEKCTFTLFSNLFATVHMKDEIRGEVNVCFKRRRVNIGNLLIVFSKKKIAIRLTTGILHFFEKENSQGLFFSYMGKFNNSCKISGLQSRTLYAQAPREAGF